MNNFLYKNKRTLLYISLFLVVFGAFLGYLTYEIEPWETVGGVICGIGSSFTIVSLSVKKQ